MSKRKYVKRILVIGICLILSISIVPVRKNVKATQGETPQPDIDILIDLNKDGTYETNIEDVNNLLSPGTYNLCVKLVNNGEIALSQPWNGIHIQVWKDYIGNVDSAGLIQSVDIGDFYTGDMWVGPDWCSEQYISTPAYFKYTTAYPDGDTDADPIFREPFCGGQISRSESHGFELNIEGDFISPAYAYFTVDFSEQATYYICYRAWLDDVDDTIYNPYYNEYSTYVARDPYDVPYSRHHFWYDTDASDGGDEIFDFGEYNCYTKEIVVETISADIDQIMADAKLIEKVNTESTIDINAIIADEDFGATLQGNYAVWEVYLNGYGDRFVGGQSWYTTGSGESGFFSTFPDDVIIRFAINEQGEFYAGAIGPDADVLAVLTDGGINTWGTWGYPIPDDKEINSPFLQLDERANLLASMLYNEYMIIAEKGYRDGGPQLVYSPYGPSDGKALLWFDELNFELVNKFNKPITVILTAIHMRQSDTAWSGGPHAGVQFIDGPNWPFYNALNHKWNPKAHDTDDGAGYRWLTLNYDNVGASYVSARTDGDNANSGHVKLDGTTVISFSNWDSLAHAYRTSNIYPEDIELYLSNDWSVSIAYFRMAVLGGSVSYSNVAESPTGGMDGNPEPLVWVIPPSVGGRIVYASDESGNYDIWLMDLARGSKVQLTDEEYDEIFPYWSPNGNKIAYLLKKSDYEHEIWIMDADGSNKQKIATITSGGELVCTILGGWLDDNNLVFSKVDGSVCHHILYKVDLNGNVQPILDPNNIGEGEIWFADYNPITKKLVFEAQSGCWDPTMDIYIADYDVATNTISDIVLLFSSENHYDGRPRISPDGQKVVFVHRVAEGAYNPPPEYHDLWVVNIDGSDPHPITSNFGENYNMRPTFVDDDTIIFFAKKEGAYDLWMMDLDGSNPTKLTNTPYNETWPDFYPISEIQLLEYQYEDHLPTLTDKLLEYVGREEVVDGEFNAKLQPYNSISKVGVELKLGYVKVKDLKHEHYGLWSGAYEWDVSDINWEMEIFEMVKTNGYFTANIKKSVFWPMDLIANIYSLREGLIKFLGEKGFEEGFLPKIRIYVTGEEPVYVYAELTKITCIDLQNHQTTFQIGEKILTLPQRLYYTAPIFYKNHHQLEVLCPVNVTITDQYGRIISDTGVNEIPNAFVFNVNETKIFFLPANLSYSIEIDAYGEGMFNFTRISPIGNNISISIFRNLSVTASTKAYIEIPPDVAECEMRMDYNGDGTIDEEIQPDTSQIFPFTPFILSYTIDGFAHSAIVGDVDNNGLNELVIMNHTEKQVRIYCSSLCLETSITFDETPICGVIADVDNDGKNELIVGTSNGDAGGYVYVGEILDGSFTQEWKSPLIQSFRDCEHLAVGDANNNGYKEIAVGVGYYGRYLVVYEYNGNGYTQIFDDDIGSDVGCTEFADVDNDGIDELIVGTGCWSDYNIRIYDDYTLTKEIYIGGVVWLETGDVDGDGFKEIIAACGTACGCGTSTPPPVLRIIKWNGTDYEIIWTSNNFPQEGDPCGLETKMFLDVGNLLYDNKNEIAALTWWANPIVLRIYSLMNSNYTCIYETNFTDEDGRDIEIGDYDNDGQNELIIVTKKRVMVYEIGFIQNYVRIMPPFMILPKSSETTFNIMIDNLPNGLSGYNITISLSNSSVAEIEAIEFPEWALLHQNSSLPSSSAWIKAVDLNDEVKEGERNVVLATITIKALNEGITSINIDVNKLDDDNGYPINVSIQDGILNVIGLQPLPGFENPPTDPDNDGLFEDLNGNGLLDFDDVVEYFKHFEWIENNYAVNFIDFNLNSRIDFDDVVELFKEV